MSRKFENLLSLKINRYFNVFMYKFQLTRNELALKWRNGFNYGAS